MNRIRMRLINGERWYSALDLGGPIVSNARSFCLDNGPYKWLQKNIPASHRSVVRSFGRKITYIKECEVRKWMEYVHLRKTGLICRQTAELKAAQLRKMKHIPLLHTAFV